MHKLLSRPPFDSAELLKLRGDEVVGLIDAFVSDYQRNAPRVESGSLLDA